MRRVFMLVVLSCTLLVFPSFALAEADDDIPGVPLPASPVLGYLDKSTDANDVYSLAMKKSDRLSLTINGESGLVDDTSVLLQVFSPDAMGIDGTEPIESERIYSFPGTLDLGAPVTGTFYVAVRVTGASWVTGYGNYTLAWTCKSPTITALTTRSRSIRRGGAAKVAGVVRYAADSTAVPGKSVTLQKSRTGTGWVKVTSKRTDSSGHFSFTVRPTRSTYYRVDCTSTSAFLRSVSTRIRIRVL